MNYAYMRPDCQALTAEQINNKIIYVSDNMPLSNDIRIDVQGKNKYFHNTIQDLFDAAGVDIKEKLFVFDHYLMWDDFQGQAAYTARILLDSVISFRHDMPSWNTIPQQTVTKHFTFPGNKPRPHRVMLNMLIANLFVGKPIAYSWLGHDDPQNIVDELLLHTNYKFDTKLGLDSFFVEAPEYFSAGKTPAGARAWAMPDISLAFRDYIYQGLYADSTVSFITEPNFFENGNILTEKTLIPIYAGHFPIWPGSYKSAETTKKIGFDVFDDIIDHSYQYLAHPGERIIQAITKNIDLLNNLELQQHYREIYEDRLNANLQLARDVTQLQQNILNNLDQHAIVHDFKDIRLFKVA